MRVQLVSLLVTFCSCLTFAQGQDCQSLASASPSTAVRYLDRAANSVATPECVLLAFRRVASSPPEKSVPLLIALLDYKRPLNEGERLGIYMHGDTPEALYPAVHELSLFGKTAEPKLIQFLATAAKATPIESSNALYTLLLIHRGDSLGVLRELKKAGQALADRDARDRLLAAANSMIKWCDERIRPQCRRELLW